jgi:hypothetical protein
MRSQLLNFQVNDNFKYLKENSIAIGAILEWYQGEGLSIDNDYFPLFSVKINKTVYNKKVINYGIPKGTEDSRDEGYPYRTYPRFFNALYNNSLPKAFKTATMTYNLFVFKGCIYELINDMPNILFMVGIKTSHIPNLGQDLNAEKTENYALLFSLDFATKPKYKNVYKKVYDTIAPMHLKEGVEVIITKDIVKRYFKNNVAIPKFRNITELQEYLNSFNKKIIDGI